MEIYIDDILMKNTKATLHISDLTEAFDALRKHRMKLNPTKCIFGVISKKFLNFIVTKRGIEANPEKIKMVLDIQPPNSRTNIQRLAG